MSSRSIQRLFQHVKCRGPTYPLSDVPRFPVPEEKIDWSVAYPEYQPVHYESPVLQGKPWADPPNPKLIKQDGRVDRSSFCGAFDLAEPRNPYGRTGVVGRGLLGRWGPNHAADPIVSRWKVTPSGTAVCHRDSGKRILQICIVRRRDSGELALPGGMVDPGETVSARREFAEEALNSNDSAEAQRILEEFFRPENGVEVYRNYVDDPRNTDNAWMETVAVNFHDETGHHVGRFQLCAGDDAADVQWMDMDGRVSFYANHRQFIERVVQRLDAHW